MLKHDLNEQLARAGRALQRQAGLSLFLKALGLLLVVIVLLFGLDVILHLGSGARVAMGALYLALLFLVGGVIFYVAQLRQPRPEHVARVLETRDASLGSRLINFLQLRQQVQSTAHPELTRSLAERAVTGYAAELQTRNLSPLTVSPTLRRDLKSAAITVGAVALLLAVAYPISSLEFLRFLDPFGDHPPYSLTQVEIVEPADGLQVDYNGQVVVKARTAGHHPDDLFLTFSDPEQPGVVSTIPMYGKGELGFYQAIEHIKSNLLVHAATKNGRSVSKTRRVNVILTPRIEHAFVEVTPPAYTGIKPHETSFDFKNLTALVGSQIKFRLRSNRPLSGGAIDIPDTTPVALAPTSENEVSGSFEARDSTRLQFSVTDPLGHVSQANPNAPLTVTHDLPPEITIDTPAQDGFVCDDFVVEARISAADDYGLKTIRIHRALNEVYSSPKIITFDQVTRSSAHAVNFDIKALGVQPGDTISLFAEAVDTCPEPHLARTRTLHLMVISTDEYNNFIREQTDISDIEGKYSALLNEFHDRIDEQRELTEKIQELEKKMQDPAARKELAAELDKLMAQQAELNKKLEALADHMEHFVREKPLYDLESELQQSLSEKAEEIRKSVAANDQALQKSLESTGKPGTPQDQLDALASLEKESQQQADRLAPKEQQAREETLPPIKDAALMNALINDFNALKYLRDTQDTLAAQAQAYNSPTTTEEDKLGLKQMAGTEKAVEWALGRLADNLREHADAAEKTFPKAAASARDLADTLEQQRLAGMAGRAANTMLNGEGTESSAMADRLRDELEKLFADSEPGQGEMQSELDHYLQLQRGLNAGNTFQQMSRSRKFGLGKGGDPGSGQGNGGGLDGFATSSGGNFGVFGNETLGGDPKSGGKGFAGQAVPGAAGQKMGIESTDTIAGDPAVNRLSRETRSESPMDEYRGVIEAYFNSITNNK